MTEQQDSGDDPIIDDLSNNPAGSSAAESAEPAAAAASDDSDDSEDKRKRFKLSSEQTRISALIALIVLFAVLNPNFLTRQNLTNILVNASVVGVIACAMTLLLVARQVDLSVGSSAALTAAVFAVASQTMSTPAAMLIALVAALSVSAVNIVAIVFLRVNSIIVTLAGFLAYRGLAKVVLDGRTVALDGFTDLGRRRLMLFDTIQIPVPVIALLIVVAFFYFVMKYTRFGTHMYAIGANPESARLAGIRIEWEVSRGFILAGVAVFIAALTTVSMVGMAAPTTGERFEFLALTAVVLGGATLAGGRGTVIGTMIAMLILAVVDNGLVLMGIRPFWQEVARGTLLLLAVVFDQISRRKEAEIRMTI